MEINSNNKIVLKCLKSYLTGKKYFDTDKNLMTFRTNMQNILY